MLPSYIKRRRQNPTCFAVFAVGERLQKRRSGGPVKLPFPEEKFNPVRGRLKISVGSFLVRRPGELV
jgi:hypothetical protein